MQKRLQEINIIRPIVITALVLLHSFAIFYGAWPMPDGVDAIKLYSLLPCFIRGFLMETIAFVAGYVFSYQVNDLGRVYTLRGMVKKKFIRLLVPCWILGFVYALCFSRDEPVIGTTVAILNGIGHLWYLTMLFWCFVVLFFIHKYIGRNTKRIFICFFPLLMLSCVPIPVVMLLGFDKMPHFLFYVYLGYVSYIYRSKVYDYLRDKRLMLFLIYTAFVVLSFYVLPEILKDDGMAMLSHMLVYVMLKISLCLTAMSGCMLLYVVVVGFLKRKENGYVIPEFVNRANNICYGIYVFHQFILMWIYYDTNIPLLISSYILPILSFVVTLSLSVLFTIVFTKFRFGRFLVG